MAELLPRAAFCTQLWLWPGSTSHLHRVHRDLCQASREQRERAAQLRVQQRGEALPVGVRPFLLQVFAFAPESSEKGGMCPVCPLGWFGLAVSAPITEDL